MPRQVGQRPPKRPRLAKSQGRGDNSSHLWRLLYYDGYYGDNPGLEKLSYYQPGGYHPIHLGDELHDGRFRVMHKLGHGGSSTVWLCRDQSETEPRYVAVKMFLAGLKESECRELLACRLQDEGMDNKAFHLCLPRQRFTSKSPNGTHICLVYPALGPTVNHAAAIFDTMEDVDDIIRKISRSLVAALDTLHRRGICHADLRPANVVLGLQSLDGFTEEQVLAQFGKPDPISIKVRENSLTTTEIPYAPRHIVDRVDFCGADPSLILPRAVIIDLGQAVETAVDNPPTGIPVDYAAPELIRHLARGQEVDLWSLACTLYEVRVGWPLFEVPHMISFWEEDYDDEISTVLGEPGKSQSDRATASQICKRAFGDCITPEQMQWAEMLASLLKYDPHQRLPAKDVLKNPWFGGELAE